MKKFLFF